MAMAAARRRHPEADFLRRRTKASPTDRTKSYKNEGIRQYRSQRVAPSPAVMDRTPHIMLVGKGAEDFAQSLPEDAMVEFEPDEYF